MHIDFSDAGILQIHLHFIFFNNFVSYPVFRQILATTFSLDYYVLVYMLLWISIGLNPCFELYWLLKKVKQNIGFNFFSLLKPSL